MKALISAFCTLAVLLSLSLSANADNLRLVGRTLNKPAKAGTQPPAKITNALGNPTTTICPFGPASPLVDLLAYARQHYPAIYRQAFALRRTGATQAGVRNFLETNICGTGAPYPIP